MNEEDECFSNVDQESGAAGTGSSLTRPYLRRLQPTTNLRNIFKHKLLSTMIKSDQTE